MNPPRIVDGMRKDTLAIVGFHDGYLRGVRSTSDGILTFWVTTLDERQFTISITNTINLWVNGFCGANIVHEICIYDAHSCPLRLFASALRLEDLQFKEILNQRFAEFQHRKQYLLEMSMSDECSVLAIHERSAESILIEP